MLPVYWKHCDGFLVGREYTPWPLPAIELSTLSYASWPPALSTFLPCWQPTSQSHVFQYVPQTHQARSSFRAKFALSDPSGWNDFIWVIHMAAYSFPASFCPDITSSERPVPNSISSVAFPICTPSHPFACFVSLVSINFAIVLFLFIIFLPLLELGTISVGAFSVLFTIGSAHLQWCLTYISIK